MYLHVKHVRYFYTIECMVISLILAYTCLIRAHAQSQKIWSGGPDTLFSHQLILQRDVLTSLEKQLDQRSPIAPPGGSLQEFQRKSLATCNFSGDAYP